MKVRATQVGFYGGRHIDVGTVFDVTEDMFADSQSKFGWMEKFVEPESTVKPAGDPVIVETQHDREVREWLENEKKAG